MNTHETKLHSKLMFAPLCDARRGRERNTGKEFEISGSRVKTRLEIKRLEGTEPLLSAD